MENDSKYALYTVVTENYILLAKLMIYSFLKNNTWFDGDINIICYRGYEKELVSREELAVLYGKNTDYQLLNECNIIAYDDYLRLNYPGVLLIELSKMGGNPIGPYGDKNNIYQVFHDNVRAIDSWLEFFFKKCSHTKVLSNNIPHIEKR